MRLKGIKITRRSNDDYEVVPLFFSKGKGTQTASFLKQRAATLAMAVKELLAVLVARGHLKE